MDEEETVEFLPVPDISVSICFYDDAELAAFEFQKSVDKAKEWLNGQDFKYDYLHMEWNDLEGQAFVFSGARKVSEQELINRKKTQIKNSIQAKKNVIKAEADNINDLERKLLELNNANKN